MEDGNPEGAKIYYLPEAGKKYKRVDKGFVVSDSGKAPNTKGRIPKSSQEVESFLVEHGFLRKVGDQISKLGEEAITKSYTVHDERIQSVLNKLQVSKGRYAEIIQGLMAPDTKLGLPYKDKGLNPFSELDYSNPQLEYSTLRAITSGLTGIWNCTFGPEVLFQTPRLKGSQAGEYFGFYSALQIWWLRKNELPLGAARELQQIVGYRPIGGIKFKRVWDGEGDRLPVKVTAQNLKSLTGRDIYQDLSEDEEKLRLLFSKPNPASIYEPALRKQGKEYLFVARHYYKFLFENYGTHEELDTFVNFWKKGGQNSVMKRYLARFELQTKKDYLELKE